MARDGLPAKDAPGPAITSNQTNADRYRQVRGAMPCLAHGLSPEDLSAQSMPDCSPGKWHLAHTSWFFETMILAAEPGYQAVDARFQQLFNSYYESLGERVARHHRGLMTRPSLNDVLTYRREIDRRMVDWLGRAPADARLLYLFELGLHHDQQHQELFLMDMLNLMACSPLDPAAYAEAPRATQSEPPRGGMVSFGGGLTTIGHDGQAFAFDNERPWHNVWLEPFSLAADLVTNEEWIAFIEDGGYDRPEFWLSDGWAVVRAEGWAAPLYWRREDDGWTTMSLTGRIGVDPAEPVRHVSFYEADAFARWVGKRLPTEGEWEHAARAKPQAFSNMTGEAWQWTASAYAPYPGFRPTPGTAGEYNGKFMANQMVLRGGSFATPEGHARVTYRNFFYPDQRWAFAGVRLAADATDGRSLPDEDHTAAFRQDLIAGLSQVQKAVPPKWFYDAEGSRLFEDITVLDEYYPTRQETALLRMQAAALTAEFGPDAVLVEFGSGASEKTRLLLDAAPELGAYVPLDISETALSEAAGRLRAAYPTLRVEPVLGDFETLAPLPHDLPKGRRIGFFPGSTIGNLEPEEAVRFLAAAKALLGEGALFILGVDLVKAPEILVAAYDDPQGVTAAFNRNLLVRANAELGANFDLDAFRHRAVWNAERSRIEMHLEAVRPTFAQIDEHRFEFATRETIHTESSRKFNEASVADMAEASGWRMVRFYASPAPSVALALMAT